MTRPLTQSRVCLCVFVLEEGGMILFDVNFNMPEKNLDTFIGRAAPSLDASASHENDNP